MCHSHMDHRLLEADVRARTASVPMPHAVSAKPPGSWVTRIRVFWAVLVAGFALSSCGSTEPASSTAMLAGSEGDGKISVQFNDFAQATRCTVQTPKGALIVNEMPGKIEYPALYRASPITCSSPRAGVYAIDVETSLPVAFRVADMKAFADGRLIGTISTASDILNIQRADAVRRLN